MAIAIKGTSPGSRPSNHDRELAELASGAAAADGLRPRPLGHVLLFAIVAFFVIILTWAHFATLDEVTRGEGRVIPSRQVQIVQNLEGGIVAQMLVKNGDIVEEGQVLMRIDNVRAQSDYREKRARYLSLLASIARLQAEIDETAIEFPLEVMAEARDIAEREMQLFRSRQDALDSQLAILRRQAEQREQELGELEARIENLRRSYELAVEQYDVTKPLADQRIVPKTQMLAIEREVNDFRSQLEEAELSVPRIRTAIAEANRRIESAFSSFRSEALAELNERTSELSGIREIVLAGEDRVKRTEVRSPVRGTIKQININTIGGVIDPGEDLIEIVPLEDSLLVEAQIRPADIAFLSPGLPATVKVTAYDFSIYGGLPGTVEEISADTIMDDKGQSFYRVRIRTEDSFLGRGEDPLLIIPGMTAQVDVLTGEKTVLSYILKPILKARDNAMRER